MGLIISKLWKKQSTIERLESIDRNVDALLNLKRRNTQREKQYMGSLLLYSVILYLLMAVFFYFYYEARGWKGRATQILPLLLFPVLIFGIRKLLQWYFVKRVARNQIALEDLRQEKKKILEEVKDKESYKKAKEILDRYDPASSPPPLQQGIVTNPNPALPVPKLRQRPMTARGARTPNTPRQRTPLRGPPSLAPRLSPQQQLMMRSPATARPILPRERGTVDKLMDFLVGDGPSSRYALICKHCYSHNGMALQEEFEYLAFKCAYCGTFNPSKKVRPQAPQLPTAFSPAQGSTGQGSTPHAAGNMPQIRRRSSSEGGSLSESNPSSLMPSTPTPDTPIDSNMSEGEGNLSEGDDNLLGETDDYDTLPDAQSKEDANFRVSDDGVISAQGVGESTS